MQMARSTLLQQGQVTIPKRVREAVSMHPGDIVESRADGPCRVDTARLWAKTPRLGFVGAYLGLRAQREGMSVFTKNIRHFERFGIRVPNPLERYTP
jgi:AbrB family looped-hinge helix DNA binding protein